MEGRRVVRVARRELGAGGAKREAIRRAAEVLSKAERPLLLAGLIDTQSVRMLNARGSLSGAILGGLMFGAGMVLARGCSSRLLVLAANGNLRSLLSGLVFAVTVDFPGALRAEACPVRS